MTSSSSEPTAKPRRRVAFLLLAAAGSVPLWMWARPGDAPVPQRESTSTPAQTSAPPGDDGGLHTLARSTELPPVMEESVLKASLAALAAKGADLSRPMPSRHRIICGDRAAAAKVAAWARASGFTAEEPVPYNSHGGVERLMVDLVREEIPEPASLLAEGRAVLAAMSGIDGALYHTWMSAAPPR